MKLPKGLNFICRKCFTSKMCQQSDAVTCFPFFFLSPFALLSFPLRLLGSLATAASTIPSAATSCQKDSAICTNTTSIRYVSTELHQNWQRMLLLVAFQSQLVGFSLRVQGQKCKACRATENGRPTFEEVFHRAWSNTR